MGKTLLLATGYLVLSVAGGGALQGHHPPRHQAGDIFVVGRGQVKVRLKRRRGQGRHDRPPAGGAGQPLTKVASGTWQVRTAYSGAWSIRAYPHQ